MELQRDRIFWKECLSFIHRRRNTVLAVFTLTAAVVIAGAFLIPPKFTARTTLIVKYGREFIYRPEVGSLGNSPTFKLEEMVNAEVEILNSRDLAQQVIRDLGIKSLFPEILESEVDRERAAAKAVAEFRSRVSVAAVLESSIIRATFEHRDPEIAARALNLLVDRFMEKHLEIFSEPKRSFLSERLKEYEESLATAENALAEFKQEVGIFLPPEQKRLLLSRKFELEGELNAAELKALELEGKLASLQADRNSPRVPLPGPITAEQREALVAHLKELTRLQTTLSEERAKGLGGLAARASAERLKFLDDAMIRLLDLELEERKLSRTFNDDSREVAGLRSDIQHLHSFVKEKGKDIEAMLEADVSSELVLVKAKRKKLAEEIERLVKEMHRLDSNEKKLRMLERQVTVQDRNVQAFLEKHGEAQITEELDKQKMVNIKVIERATPPIAPTGLSRKMRIGIGVIVGVIVGVAAALFLELIKVTETGPRPAEGPVDRPRLGPGRPWRSR